MSARSPAGGNATEGANEARRQAILRDAAAGMRHLEATMERHQIQCGWQPTGRLTALWTTDHWKGWEKRARRSQPLLRCGRAAWSTAESMREEIGSDFYRGGVLIGRAGHLHPAAALWRPAGGGTAGRRQGAGRARRVQTASNADCTAAMADRDEQAGRCVRTTVVIATNGYTGRLVGGLHRQVIPVTTHMIATEEMPEDLARSLMPRNRAVSETRRVINHYRLSPDGRRLLFGGRARFFPAEERVDGGDLHRADGATRFRNSPPCASRNSWGGRVAVPFDYMPHIGEHERRPLRAGLQRQRRGDDELAGPRYREENPERQDRSG